MTYVFALGLGIILFSAFLAILYLRNPLYLVLVDLCGTADRARFWTAFSNVTLLLIPVIFALDYRPSAATALLDLSGQIEQALIGLVASVFAIGIVLTMFIRRAMPRMATTPATEKPIA